ncbi:MAG TPA: hypothetical protein VFU31_30735, partial [Candidatus Binatia bacterium]|nr:hypothetical protein [Candidatus Binatia bacterium]
MQYKALAVLLVSLTLPSIHLVEAQQPAKVYRMGVLISASPSIASRRIQAFQQGLRELGYVEGKNI